ncbi:sodium-dependent transporter [Clostridium sediminicola]|uniref:sodium-dependent transporter n=1 Tax=Clostridium sediminicola TaxID=3114879 RepID=UPI0031F26B0F
MENKKQQREVFSSKLGIIAAAAGSAIGLGNIWKFPYITGIYGGAAFIFVYLICIVLIGMPVMLSEFLIGRRAKKNAVASFEELAPRTPWFLTGGFGVLTGFIILSFYGVVAGWTLHYVYTAVINGFKGQSPEQLNNMFGSLVTNPWQPVMWQVIFMILTAVVILGGVKDGIEKYAKILMPLLLVIIIILDIRAITLPGAGEGLAFLFKPDFSKINGEAVMAALGHAFFTLSIGMAAMITYGSYIGKKENLGVTTLQVSLADTFIALLSGLAIFPAVFAFGVKPNVGPGLVFVTLPNVFNMMPGGYIFSILFFVLLAVAALTSSISLLEVVVAYFDESLNMSRKKATITAAGIITILGAFESLTYSVVKFNLPLFKGGEWHTLAFLDWMIELSDLMLPIGGFFIALFVGYVMKNNDVKNELNNDGKLELWWYGTFRVLIKVLAPIAILITFINMTFGIL